MKAVKLQNHPNYKLMKQSDVVSFFHLQMPRWLFFDPKYNHLSLETKVAYTFLLNRFQLSKMNNWVNNEGEVFIIFPREKLAEEMGVSYRKAISCFKELLAADLIWEQRIGRGNANHIYLASVVLSEPDAMSHNSAPFVPRSAESACLDVEESDTTPTGNNAVSIDNLSNPQDKRCENGTCKHAEPSCPDMPISHPNK